jgi:DNA invertase Pin-like site-specific DNA recombinase
MEQTNNHKRCVLLARTATSEQGSGAMEKQIATLAEFAEKQGMTCVDDVCLLGVSGHQMDEHLRSLIERKRTKNDFDFILVSDLTRLGRRNAVHLILTLDQLSGAGVQVISVNGGEHNGIISALNGGTEGVNHV